LVGNLFYVQPDIGASLTTCPANKPWLKIGQPDFIGPSIAADRNPVRAMGDQRASFEE
jgi:hypothetical protein